MTAFRWPPGRQAALSLTFDDGLPSHWRTAVPLLDAADLKGTFYVNPPADYRAALAPWPAIVARGHELGNHTASHPCSGMFDFAVVPPRKPLEEWTLEAMDADIALAQRRLDALCPGQGPTSFAYPCYQAFVGQGAAHQSYVPVVLKHCVAARARGERHNDPARCDLHYLASLPCEGMSGAELVAAVEACLAQRRWGILTFHGVGEGHLSVTETALRTLLAHLVQRRDVLWTDTVRTVAAYVKAAAPAGAAAVTAA